MEPLTLVGLQIPQPIKLVIHYIEQPTRTTTEKWDHQTISQCDLLNLSWDDYEKFGAELPTVASLQVDEVDFIPAAVEKLWADLLTRELEK